MKKFLLGLLMMLAMASAASAQCVGGISRCPPATLPLGPGDLMIIDQVNPSAPTGYTTRQTPFLPQAGASLSNANTWLALQAFSAGATVPTLSFGTNTTGVASTAFVQAAVAAGPGSLPVVATPTALGGATIPASQTTIVVSAMTTSGTSTCGMSFSKGTSAPTGIFGEVLNTSSGIYWEPQYNNSPVQACQFGTIADASFNAVTNVMTGTDNTVIIQAAINYAIQNNFNTVCLTDGKYKITDTLHMGWGDSFYTIGLSSCNGGRNSFSGATAGVSILATQTDRCAINFQGSRSDFFRGISLIGMNFSYFFFGGLPNPWPTDPNLWIASSLRTAGTTNSGGIQRYAPYAGLCMDAYSGNPPSTISRTLTGRIDNGVSGTGNVLTVTAAPNGGVLLGAAFTGSGVTAGTYVTGFLTGIGGAGTYTVNTSQSVALTTLTLTYGQYPFVINYPAFTQLITSTASISQASPAVVDWGTTANRWLNANCNTVSALSSTANCPIIFTSGSLPAGFSLNTLYYVKTFLSGNTFTISATQGGTALNNTNPAATGLGAARQFGMNLSSDVLVEDAGSEGFAVAINSNSSVTNVQNDFLKLNRVYVQNCAYCISVGNDQSRNVDINNVVFGFTHTLLTNNQFGVGTGLLGGPITNVSGGEGYQFFQIGNLSFGNPISIKDCYAEGNVRFGSFAGGSSANSVSIEGCQLANGPAGGSNLVPVALIEATSGFVSFNIRDFATGGGNRVDTLVHGTASIVIDGGSFSNGTVGLPFLNLPGIPVAYNYAGGGILVSGSTSSFPASNGFLLQWLRPTTSTTMTSQTAFSSAVNMGPQVNVGSARGIFTQASKGFYDGLNERYYQFASGPQNGVVNLSSGAVTGTPAAISSCDILTFTYLAANQAANAQSNNINTGDILYWNGDGTIFVVTQVAALSGGAYPITARQMNNMTINPDTSCLTNNINDPTLSGNTTIIHAAGTSYADVAPIGAGTPGPISIPREVWFGDIANGSTSVQNIGITGPQSTAPDLNTYLSVGDIFWTSPFGDPTLNYPFAIGTKLSAVTNSGSPGGGAITLSTAANQSGRFPLLPLPVIGVGTPTNAISRLPIISASGGTCAVTATPTSGNQVRGTFALTGACAAGNTVTMTFAIIAPTGWQCGKANTVVATPVQFLKTGGTTTTITMTPTATTGATDVVSYAGCEPY